MKIEPPVQVYTAATPPADAQPKPFTFNGQLLVNKVIPIVGDSSIISSAVSNGNKVYLNRRSFPPGLLAAQLQITPRMPPSPVDQPPEQPPKTTTPVATAISVDQPPQIVTMARTADDKQAITTSSPLKDLITRAAAAPSAFEISKEGFHVLKFAQTATHADIVSNLRVVGVSPYHADSTANVVLDYLHTHGSSSVFFGVTIGGAVAALVGFFRPKTHIQTLGKIGVTTALIAGLLFYFLVPANNPFVGEWKMNAADSRYAVGNVPRAGKTVIAEDGKALTINQDVVDYDGKSQQQSYVIYPDAKDHPAQGIPGVDTTFTVLAKKKLTTLFKLNGRPLRSEERAISRDEKTMTETVTLPQPDGKELKNVSVYDQK